MTGKPNTTALVIGAGIGGMTAALDIANSGYQVLLVDKLPNIGGKMAQLSETFPTLDCSQCILTPRTAEVNGHPNIRMIMCTEVESVSGEPGHFTVRLHHYPRYIDVANCTACGECEKVCPVRLPSEPDEGLALRAAVYKPFPQAIPSAYVISKQGTAPCRDACPINQRAQGYVALINAGRYADAFDTIRLDNPFPSICGRVCNHKCEDACTRGAVDEPVSIAALKRFVADWAYQHPDQIRPIDPPAVTEAKRVAIIGSGPAGLTAARDLVTMGFPVTVFEALPVAGGMMRVGVPAYRLPPDVVQREVDDIIRLGVDLRLNTRVESAEKLLDEGYSAVFVAVGAHRGSRLPLPGADGADVHVATDFLRTAALGQPVDVRGRRVLVIGGGNVAVDAAQMALRLGAGWVGMACLEPADKMLASAWEIRECREEGIEIFNSRNFLAIERDSGSVTGVTCEEVASFSFTSEGLKVEAVPDSRHTIPADVVIFAIGQKPDLAPLGESVQRSPRGLVAVNPDTLQTSHPAIFAGGDAVTGTTFIVDAIAAGHKAARNIAAYLRGEMLGQMEERLPVYRPTERQIEQRFAAGVSAGGRQVEASLDPDRRRHTFDEIHLGLTEEQARAEAARCLNCGGCAECLQCVAACQRGALDHSMGHTWEDVEVGAIIAATGLDLLPVEKLPEYGGGMIPDVVTTLQFERLLSASGPTSGEVRRISDGAIPKHVVWVQCAGSREPALSAGNGAQHQGVAYCSKICCMISSKQAMLYKHRVHDGQATIFYIDIRAGGKGYDEFIQRAMEEEHVAYLRGKVSRLEQAGDKVRVYGADTLSGRAITVDADMVVLAVASLPNQGTVQAAQALGLPLSPDGFHLPLDSTFAPIDSAREGIFLCGAAIGPRDIPETVAAGSAAAAKVLSLFARWQHEEMLQSPAIEEAAR